jgi:cytochrome c-type biogenesis protein CcmH/NrfG
MKIKPIYIYGGVVILTILFLVFFSSKNDSGILEKVDTNQMPDDNIHKGLQLPPGKENVSSAVKQRLEMLEKAVEENPEDTLKMREYADLLAAAHHGDEAIVYYNNILNVNPKRSDILFSLAFIYFNKKNYNKAESMVQKILLYEPDNTYAMYNLGAIAASSGDKQEAKAQWKKLIKDYPGSDGAKLAEGSLKKL